MTYLCKRISAQDMVEEVEAYGRLEELGGEIGIYALHEYYENLARDTGEPIELDVAAFCCDWTHYSSAREAIDEDVLTEDAALKWLQDQTTVLELDDGSILVQVF